MPTAGRRELILSEEQLAVSTVRVPARRVRLEKYVVTETRTITVQVSHEEVRLVEVGLDEGDPDTDTDVQATDPDRWLTVSEERIAITTEVVPLERVRLAVTSVSEDRTVRDDIRREQVAFETDTGLPPASNDHTHPTVMEEQA
jgi:uncharacterized protein (TIGR02271 family)